MAKKNQESQKQLVVFNLTVDATVYPPYQREDLENELRREVENLVLRYGNIDGVQVFR